MVRYWFSLSPLVVILTVVTLALPWLGLIVLMIFALIALASLGAIGWGIVFVLERVVRAVGRLRHSPSGTLRQPATLSAARPSTGPPRSMPAGATVVLASPPAESERLT